MKKTKKILSLVLAVLIMICTVPMAYAEDSTTYEVGDIIQFGSYPQSEVKDETLIAELNALAPEWEDWTSYGYYSGDGNYGSMVQGDWMRYVDIVFKGIKYRGVKFIQYRPNFTYYRNESYFGHQKANGYTTSTGYSIATIYWFKFEPIYWKILDPSIGLVMCESIIDSQPYSNTVYYNSSAKYKYEYFNDVEYTNFAWDYETSSIRKWLNELFYNTAFLDLEREEIKTTDIDDYYGSIDTIDSERLDSKEIKDNIFLLSHNDVRDTDFGFKSDASVCDDMRKAKGSDYAKCQGLEVYRSSGSECDGNSPWYLRSPGDSSDTVYRVDSLSYCGTYNYVYRAGYGIRPAMILKYIAEKEQPEHTHSYTSKVTKNATCTATGVRTYTCSKCSDSYTESIAKTSHNSNTTIPAVAATCTKTGLTEGKKCSACGTVTVAQQTVAKKAHSYTSSVTTQPTCTKEGVRTYKCSCGASYTESIAKKSHTIVVVPAVAATCTKTGLTEGKKCSVCGTVTVAQTTVAAKGHKDDNADYKCDYGCGYEYEKPADPTPDTPSDPTDNCSCNCHKGGLVGFFFKIINFFQKLFGMNKVCACGVKH